MTFSLVGFLAALLLLASQRSAAFPCTSSQFTAPPLVEDTAGALQLAEALNCSGGSFDVEWVGSVVVEDTIRVFGGTTLNVTGDGGGSSFVNGASKTTLFEVQSGTLHMSRLTLANGDGVQGGAIHATDSYLTVVDCTVWNNTGDYGAGTFLKNSKLETTNSSFAGNTAFKDGGAVYMNASNVLVGENVLFRNNNASSGGAIYLIGGSFLDLAGDAAFSDSTAALLGGGISARDSTVHLTGRSEFAGNSASYGGAAYANNCSVWVHGDALFVNNDAGSRGGAMASDVSAIYVSGTASFQYNSARDGAGGLNMWGTIFHVQASGEADFSGNTADSGGAMYMGSSTLEVEGELRFVENGATRLGGALQGDDSFIDISGNALWERNSLPELGGGLHTWNSDISVQASGRATFVGNCANVGGGVSLNNGTFLAHGDIVFTDNISKQDLGGGLFILLSDILITGAASWQTNLAFTAGGGLGMLESTLWVQRAGKAEFLSNTAVDGGAVYMGNSTILVNGDITFADNSVAESGGALYIDCSVVNITGTAICANNTAPLKGGGVFAWMSSLYVMDGGNAIFFNNTATEGGGGLGLAEGAAITVTGNLTFANNRADIRAGIKMERFSSVNLAGAVTMLGNTASASGGAMHCESPTLLRLDAVQFVSNQAGISGGAITTLLAGTERRVAEEGADPAEISNCRFTENSAGDAGGAFFIAGGFVDITGSLFRNNYAGRSGGAVLASGVTQLGHCTLEGNQAGVGPAVTSTVSVSLWFTHFANNTLLCQDAAVVLDWNDTSAFEVACEACTESCSNCTVESPNRVQVCQPVLKHTNSPTADGTIEALSLHQGYWRTSSTSKDIRECYEIDACPGGTEDYCREGYQGPLCAVCAGGYTTGLGYSCLKCNTERRKATATIAVVFLVTVVVTVVLSIYLLGNSATETTAGNNPPSRGIMRLRSELKRAKMSQTPKIILVSWQIVTQFSTVASVVYPDIYEVLLEQINVVNLNVGWMLSTGCLIETNFYHNLLLSTIVPLVVCGGVVTSHIVTSCWRSNNGREARARVHRRHGSALFWVSFLVYATVTSTIFQTFACDDFDDGKSYLRADHRLECYTSTHTWFMVYAGVMGIIYPLGIPFCYAGVLYRGREAVTGAVAQEALTTDVAVLRDLWIAYRPEAYFYEIVECVRRAVLTGVIVFIFPNTAGQVTTAFLLALFFAAVFMALDPYTNRWDTWAARTGHIIVLMTMFVALLQKVNVEEEDDFSQDIFAGVLVLAHLVLVLAAGAEACGMCLTAFWEARQTVAVQSKPVAARSTRSIESMEAIPL